MRFNERWFWRLSGRRQAWPGETANDPVESAMDLAEQVLREQPQPPGAERRKWEEVTALAGE